ncbi:MAG: rhodanese-like domain-containing protein [Ignavibacteriae bacterium]|nr:rhodanese-like domain-containing protein [Ignavibacteriota bacterium]
MKTAKQILIIIVISVISGLAANAINPKGIPLILEKNIYALDTAKQKKTVDGFVNDPYDTTTKKNNNNMLGSTGKKNKEGFIEPENITVELAKNLFDRNALFVDARAKEEYDSVHVKGSINLPYEEFRSKGFNEKSESMKKYNKDGIIVVYCKGGKCEVSIDLAYEIARLGFNSVNIYRGGIAEWKEKGFPVQP